MCSRKILYLPYSAEILPRVASRRQQHFNLLKHLLLLTISQTPIPYYNCCVCVCVCVLKVGGCGTCLPIFLFNQPPSLQACTIALSNPIMADRDSTWLYHTLLWLYLTLVHLPGMTLCEITRLYHSSTWLYITLPHSTVALLDSIWVYHTLPCLYLILKSTMAIPDSTTFYLYRELCIHDKYIEHPKKCILCTLF